MRNMELPAGTKLKLNKDSMCQGYLHEITSYYRKDLVEKKLNKEDEVTLVKEWSNFYGRYYRVTKNGDDYKYDIKPQDLDIIKIRR